MPYDLDLSVMGSPCLIDPAGAARWLLVAPIIGATDVPAPSMALGGVEFARAPAGYWRGGGLAVIDVVGLLVNRAYQSGKTSYEAIGAQLGSALADPSVERILLRIDSPGGQAAGAFGMAAQIRAAAAVKPITAFADAVAYSAAYALASGATKIALVDGGGVGSIGVVMTHTDLSQAAAKAGIVVTHIHAGARKVDFSPYQALSPDARLAAEAEVNALYDQFIGLVADHRGLDVAAVRATEAGTFTADAAVRLGLADVVTTAADLIGGLIAPKGGGGQKNSGGAAQKKAKAMDETQDAAVVAVAQDKARADERARIKSIMADPAAAGRSALAQHLALSTGLSPADAAGILAASPVEAAPAATEQPGAQTGGQSQFAGEMQRIQSQTQVQPDAGSGVAGADADADKAELAALIDVNRRLGLAQGGTR